MNGTLLVLLASTTVGIDVGWQPLDHGGLEYIIQVEPEMLETLKREGFTAEVPAQARNIHRFHVVVGRAELPRQAAIADLSPSLAEPAAVSRPGYPAAKQPGTTARGQSATTGSRSGTASANALRQSGTGAARPGTSTRQPTPANSKKGAALPQQDPFAQEPDKIPPAWGGWPNEAARLDSQAEPESNPFLKRAATTQDTPLEERTVAFKASGDGDAVKAGSALQKGTQAAPQKTTTAAEPSKPWLPLTITLLLLFASLGGNIYLGWLNLEGRARYRNLLSQVQSKAA